MNILKVGSMNWLLNARAPVVLKLFSMGTRFDCIGEFYHAGSKFEIHKSLAKFVQLTLKLYGCEFLCGPNSAPDAKHCKHNTSITS